MSNKIISTFGAVLLLAAAVFAHLPPSYDASLRAGQRGTGAKPSAKSAIRAAGDYSNKGAWNKDATYKGSYSERRGDTVSHGNWNGKPLYWWAKFGASGIDEPGKVKEGGTSAWVLINSLSASDNGGTPNYVWKGWNGDLQNKSGSWAEVPTWRNGAKGAYSFTHDDIGTMPFEEAVLPGWRAARDFPDIKQSWGIYVGEMEDWDEVIEMVKEGHEMFNHSYDHTSAANRFYIFNPGDVVPEEDLDIPQEVRGLTVEGAWTVQYHSKTAHAVGSSTLQQGWGPTNPYNWQTSNANGNAAIVDRNGDWSGPLREPYYEDGTYIDTLKASNDLVDIYAYPYWEGLSPNADAFFLVGNDTIPTIMKITPKSGTEKITLSTGQELYVNKSARKISVNATGWFELSDILDRYPFYNNKAVAQEGAHAGQTYVEADQGRPGFVLNLFTAMGWDGPMQERNVKQANNEINSNLYSRVGATPYFKNGKRSEYFGYPFDVFDETMHKYLEDAGFVGARGGAKSGVPMSGDFFHPYRIDFDAFFIERNNWDATKGGYGAANSEWVYPNNAHVLLGLNEMVDEIINKKGYMIREFHAVADFPTATNDWYDNGGNPDLWPVNDPDKGKGGWWGGIAEFQLRAHYQYLQGKIDAKDIVVYTASEAVKYRTTANAVNKTASLTKDGNQYKLQLTVTQPNLAEKYRDEISVIVSLENACGFLAVEYEDGQGFDAAPYRKPVKMDGAGRVWSVNVNPFRSNGKSILIPDGTWKGVETSQGASIYKDGKISSKQAAVTFAGIRNGQITLNLQKGNYVAELYNLQGRLISRREFSAVNGVNATGLRTDNLAKGLLILNVKQAGKLMLNQKIMVK